MQTPQATGGASLPDPPIGTTAPQFAALVAVLLLLAAATPLLVIAVIRVFHVFNLDLAVLLAVAAIAYGTLWAVGASLDKKYETIVAASFADASVKPAAPPRLTRAYGLLLICLLPFLFYLFVFALYCVELLITEALVLMNAVDAAPVFVLFGLGIVAFGSVKGVVLGFWRLLVPPKRREFGVALSADRDRRLWDLVNRVALDSGTRSVQQIRLTPDANVAVWEEGSLVRVLTGRAPRCMRIGLTAVHDMTVPELKSILRHEFAHFGNRDTAWGSFTYSMSRSLLAAWQATPGGNPLRARSLTGGIVSLNPAWWVYWLYVRLFFRSTNGFSRLREVLADWDAISYAGGECFANGLTKVVVNGEAFGRWMKANDLEGGRIPNVAHEVGALLTSMTPDELVETRRSALTGKARKTHAYDTHPDSETRLAYARRAESVSADGSEEPARGLLDDWSASDEVVSRSWLEPLAAKAAASA
jgi:Zn-dependent protease with chaperone function